MIWTLHRKLVEGRAGYQRCTKKKKKRREEEEQSRIHVVFWGRRILGLGDLCLRLSFLVEVQRPAAFQSGQCSSHAAFLVGRAGQLPCCFSSGQCSFSCLFGATGTLAVPGGWTSPPHCELRTTITTIHILSPVFQSQRSLHPWTA